MSSRITEKERCRQERLERERAAARAGRRARLRSAGLAGLVGLLAASGLTALFAFGSGDSGTSQAAVPGPFGQHYEGLEQRRKAADIPTMMDTMGSKAHFHPNLRVYVNGKPVTVPANIGIDPRRDPMEMAGLHTHDDSGKLHAEGVERATLGQSFAIWGVPLSADEFGPHRTTADKTVRMWVDGKPSDAFGELQLRDGQNIVVSYGDKDAPAPGGIEN